MNDLIVTNEKLKNLIDSFTALGLKINVGRVHWSDNTKGISIEIGECYDELYHNEKIIEELIRVPALTLSFTHEGVLRDIESVKSIIFMEELEANNVALLKKHSNSKIWNSDET